MAGLQPLSPDGRAVSAREEDAVERAGGRLGAHRSDGRNTLTVDSVDGAFSLSYMVDAIPQLCSGNGASVEAGLLTITGLYQEDPRDVLR